jgi:hypothetical protein
MATGIAALDQLLGGGWPRGAVSELGGARGSGRTGILLASLAGALRRGEAAALVDGAGGFDPGAAVRAGLPLPRLLWVRAGCTSASKRLAAAEAIVSAGGFGLVAIDFGEETPALPGAAWLRLRRVVGPPGTAVLVVATRRLPGVCGACALGLQGARPRFSDDPLLLGLEAQALLERNVGGAAGAGRGSGQASAFTLRHAL